MIGVAVWIVGCSYDWSIQRTDGGAGVDGRDVRSDAMVDGREGGASEAGAEASVLDARLDVSDAHACVDGGCQTTPPSCAVAGAGRTTCGAGGTGSCCDSLSVPAGNFLRSYDAVTFTDNTKPATVSAFRLDRYDVTVGRFRQFVTAVIGGWVPQPGSGKHTHLNGGKGLAATEGGYETGWSSTWPALPTTAAGWSTNLTCNTEDATWSTSPGTRESYPLGCLDWYEAYAFCDWDRGFMPSEAEWNYAAAGGSEQRLYPWSSPATSTTLDCTYANYVGGTGCPGAPNLVGSESPKGDARWGHSDMAGNVRNFTQDANVAYVTPCDDCANLTGNGNWSTRGGSYTSVPMYLLVSFRGTTSARDTNLGARCGRAP